MSTTLSYGYTKPADGDLGSTFWDQLAADIQQLNDHTHDGSDSATLTSTSITPTSSTIAAVDWTLVSGGRYRATVTVPSAITFDNYGLAFRITNGSAIGTEFHPTVVKINSTSFYVYTIDSSITVKVLYLV